MIPEERARILTSPVLPQKISSTPSASVWVTLDTKDFEFLIHKVLVSPLSGKQCSSSCHLVKPGKVTDVKNVSLQ